MEKINSVYAVENKIRGGAVPSDYTAAQAKRKNGPIITYDVSTFDKPTTWEIFSTWPDDIKRNYLKKLYLDYCGTCREIGDMFGVSAWTVSDTLRRLDIPVHKPGHYRVPAEKRRWKAFLRGDSGSTTLAEIVPAETAEKLHQIVKEEKTETKEEPKTEVHKDEEPKSAEEVEVQTAITNNDEFVRVDASEWVKEIEPEKKQDFVSTIVTLFSQLKEIGVKFSVKVDL